jgi:putative flippase GtrA
MLRSSHFERNITTRKQFSRFFLVGIGGTLIDLGLLTLLKYLGWQTLPASIISFLTGAGHNYLWHRYWTFTRASNAQLLPQLTQFLLVSLSNLLLNSVLMFGLEPMFHYLLSAPGWTAWAYLPAKICSIVAVMLWSFWINRFWTFKPHK